jgi:hypothetical protein
LEGFPVTGTGWPMGFLLPRSQRGETNTTLAQHSGPVKLRLCDCSHRDRFSSNARNGRNRQILFSGSGGKRNRSLNVLRLQGRKILQNLFERIAVSQAGQDCPQSYARAFEDSLSPADRWVADDSVFIVLQIASCAAQWIASLLPVHFITLDGVYVDAIFLAAVKLRVHVKISRVEYEG